MIKFSHFFVRAVHRLDILSRCITSTLKRSRIFASPHQNGDLFNNWSAVFCLLCIGVLFTDQFLLVHIVPEYPGRVDLGGWLRTKKVLPAADGYPSQY